MRKWVKHLAVLMVLCPLGAAASEDSWLHIKVEEDGPRGETVYVNLPFKLIEALLPLVETGMHDGAGVTVSGGKLRIDCGGLNDLELQVLMDAVRDAEEADYIVVEGTDERVRVAKEGGYLVIRAEEPGEKVNVRVRLEVLETLLAGDSEDLDLLAMVQALREQGEGDLVNVVSEDERVRIWIDSQSSSR